MNLHEYQAKKLFGEFDIQIPKGEVVYRVSEVSHAIQSLGGNSWVVKAQVHAGGRGKGGGVKKVTGVAEANRTVESLLGSNLVTQQTSAAGLPVNSVLIEELTPIKQELYLSALVDRGRNRIVFMASPMGGMDIEAVATNQPKQIFTVAVDPVVGLMPYQCRKLAFAIGFNGPLVSQFGNTMIDIYRLFVDKDLSLVEINPLVVTEQGNLLALDAKINIDDNALFRQKELLALNDATQEDQREHQAKQSHLNYVTLEGNIGCMVNGAGLAMATMDLIKLHGGEPANFLDVGGGITPDRVVEAFRLVISGDNVQAILVNIFGGIVRCDLIAAGIIEAMNDVQLKIPVIVRLEGTNAENGRALLETSELPVTTADGLADAASKAVKAARGHS